MSGEPFSVMSTKPRDMGGRITARPGLTFSPRTVRLMEEMVAAGARVHVDGGLDQPHGLRQFPFCKVRDRRGRQVVDFVTDGDHAEAVEGAYQYWAYVAGRP